MDVSGSVGGRLVFSSYTTKGDVVADGVLSDIDAVLEQSAGTLLSRNTLAIAVDDLVGRSLDKVLSVEVEDLLVLLEVVVLPLALPVLLPVLEVGEFACNVGQDAVITLGFRSGSGNSE
jgi:hypothetical protein